MRAYEEGDINQFMNLFDGANKNQIKRDYEQFFANSESRQFILSDVSWDIKDHSAIGKGSFEIKIKSNGEPMSSDTGSVTFNVVKNGADDITIDKVVSTVNLNDAVQQTPTTANTQISTASSLVNTSSRLHEEPVSMSSSRPVLLAKASTQNQTTSKNSITQRDLAIFLFKFVRAYEEGNIEQFMALFNNNAHTEDRKSKEAIRKDYDYFFQKTEIRQLLLGEMKWDIKDHSATGKGSFEVKIKTAGAYRLFSENGFVTFSIVKNDNDLLVTSFVHSKTN